MANTSGMTRDEVREVADEVNRRTADAMKRAKCNCGDGAQGHSPDCSWVLTTDSIWERAWDEVMSERHADD